MPRSKRSTRAPFTIFRSAAEEAHSKVEQDNWDNEGGHMRSTVRTRPKILTEVSP